ncbi:MAG: alpha/beta fold hydrolase [Nocardioidaceae bacterium]|nr:alpha/beta fold hydrolase [Nocardioidaceae bacterium]
MSTDPTSAREPSREDLTFSVDGEECAAWLYRPASSDRPAHADGPVPCVVMAQGFSLTRHNGLDAYARRFAAAGLAVLVFDYRHLGDSEGTPRQRFRVRSQTADLRAAIATARSLDGIDPERIALWGYSFGGGHSAREAAIDQRIAAVVLLCPFLDGRWRLLKTLRTSLLTALRLVPLGLLDWLGRRTLVPVTGPPGSLAAMPFPGEAEGFAAAVDPTTPWRNEISPGILVTIGLFRPVNRAAKVRCPVWLGLGERDISVDAAAIERFAQRTPQGTLQRYDLDHFEALLGAEVAADQTDWLVGVLRS